MKQELLNKLSKEGRERIIQLEAELRETQEQIVEIDLALENLNNGEALI